MDYRRLRYFISVAEELHFTRAAHRLRVAQPHLSQEIRRLEREINVELFWRTKRTVSLTPAGRVFLDRVRNIFDATGEAISAAQRASKGEVGRLAVGFVSVAAYAVMPEAIARFRKTWPDVELVLSELNSDEGVELIRSGRLDVCLLHPPRNLDLTLHTEIAWQEPLVVVMPKSHPLASKRSIDLKKLKTETWVLWRREIASRLYDEIMTACDAVGFEPRVAQRTTRLATVVSLVASGVGLAMVPKSAMRIGIAGAVYRPVLGPKINVPMSFVGRGTGVPPTVALFVRTVKAARLNERSP